MRKITSVAGCLVGLLMANASHAANEFRMSKPGASFETFRHDQHFCERASTDVKFAKHNWPRYRIISVGNGFNAEHHVEIFRDCMTEKGYHIDPHGFRTGPLWSETSD